MLRLLALSVCAAVLVACGSQPAPSPSPTPTPSPATTSRPTRALAYASGGADVTVTGGEEATLRLPLDAEESTFSRDGGFDVWYRSGDQALNVSGDVRNGEADVFVRVETGPDHAYVDSFHNLCDVTVTSYSDTELAGRFTCGGLQPWGGDEGTSPPAPIDATGTFSASVASSAQPS